MTFQVFRNLHTPIHGEKRKPRGLLGGQCHVIPGHTMTLTTLSYVQNICAKTVLSALISVNVQISDNVPKMYLISLSLKRTRTLSDMSIICFNIEISMFILICLIRVLYLSNSFTLYEIVIETRQANVYLDIGHIDY